MYRIKRSDLDNLNKACKEVEKIVDIPLEVQECEKIIARDVNNYINVINESNVKYKGVFEIDRDFHKNHSKRIVPIVLGEYFINDIPIEDNIRNYLNNNSTTLIKGFDKEDDPIFYDNHGIYDLCLGAKMKGGNKLFTRTHKLTGISEQPLGKMTRYYVSNNGYDLIKKLPPMEKNFLTETDKHALKHGTGQINMFDFIDDVKVDPEDRETNIEAGWKCTVFNKYEEGPYDINYDYYIEEVNKIINIFK